jgi:alkylhydroperoxidase/carboxymuconolactone decarboxylase family protein YurZ
LEGKTLKRQTELLYGHIFSFPGILDNIETGQCIVAALFSIDCQEQVRNHMIGMMNSGGTREELEGVRAVVMAVADKLGVVGKQGRRAIEVPRI